MCQPALSSSKVLPSTPGSFPWQQRSGACSAPAHRQEPQRTPHCPSPWAVCWGVSIYFLTPPTLAWQPAAVSACTASSGQHFASYSEEIHFIPNQMQSVCFGTPLPVPLRQPPSAAQTRRAVHHQQDLHHDAQPLCNHPECMALSMNLESQQPGPQFKNKLLFSLNKTAYISARAQLLQRQLLPAKPEQEQGLLSPTLLMSCFRRSLDSVL